MTILLLGATGRTGKWILKDALEKGHTVHALVRVQNKCKVASPRLHLFEGTPSDPVALRAAIKGCEAVVSALNVPERRIFRGHRYARLQTFYLKHLRT